MPLACLGYLAFKAPKLQGSAYRLRPIRNFLKPTPKSSSPTKCSARILLWRGRPLLKKIFPRISGSMLLQSELLQSAYSIILYGQNTITCSKFAILDVREAMIASLQLTSSPLIRLQASRKLQSSERVFSQSLTLSPACSLLARYQTIICERLNLRESKEPAIS